MAAARQRRPPLHVQQRVHLRPVVCLLLFLNLQPLRATQMQTTHADYPPFSLSCFKAQCGGGFSGRSSGSLLVAAASAVSARSSSVAAGSATAAAVDGEWAGWRVQPLSIDLVSSSGEYISACLATSTDSSEKVRDGGGGSGGGGVLLRRLQDDIASYFNDRCLAVASVGSSSPQPPAAGFGDNDLGDDDRNLDPFAIDSSAIESAARGGGCLAHYDTLAAVSVRYRCERRRRDGGGGNVITAATTLASVTTQRPSTSASQAGDSSSNRRQSDGGADDPAADSEVGERTVTSDGSPTATADAASTIDEPTASGSAEVVTAASEATAASASRFAGDAAYEAIAAGVDRNGSAPFMVVPNTPQLTALLDGLATADVVAAAAVPAVLFFIVVAVVVSTAIVCWKRRLILVVRFSSHSSSPPPSSTVIAAVAAPDSRPAEADAPPHYVAAERVCSTSLPVVGPARSSSHSPGRWRSDGSGVSWCCWGTGCCFSRRTCRGACGRRADAAAAATAAAAAAATAAGCDGRSAPRRAAGDGNSYAEIQYDGDEDDDAAASSTYDDPELGRSGRSAAAVGYSGVSSEHLYHTPLDCATSNEAVQGYFAAAASPIADGDCCSDGRGSRLAAAIAVQRSSSSPTMMHEQQGDSKGGGGDGHVHVSHSCDASLRVEQRQRHLQQVQSRLPDALPVMESLDLQRVDAASQHRSAAASAFAWPPPPPPARPPPPPPPRRPSSFANVAESCYFTLEGGFP